MSACPKSQLATKIGRVIRRRRYAHGWSQEKLAEKAGCHRNHVGYVERGVFNMSLETLGDFAKALDTTILSIIRSAKV